MQLSEVFLVVLYTSLFSFLLVRTKFFNRFLIPKKLLVSLFILRAATGIFYGWIHIHFYGGGDTLVYFKDSLIAMSKLSSNPVLFLKLTFGINHKPAPADIYPAAHAMESWTDMSSYFIVRLNILMNMISFCHYYVNVVIYNFITFFGILYLYRFFSDFMPKEKKLLLAFIFIFPSVAFWSSGLHKDGISLAAIGLILFHAEKLFERKFTFNIVLGFLAGCWLLFVVRNYLLLLLLPALIAYFISKSSIRLKTWKAITFFIFFYAILFSLKFFFPAVDVLQSMSQQQQEFRAITPVAKTLPLTPLNGKFSGLIEALPYALKNCLLEPAITNISSPLQITSATDNWIILALILLAFIFMKKKQESNQASILLCLLFSLSVFWFTGSIVPNLGALVRYKMPGMLFIAVGGLLLGDWMAIFRILIPLKFIFFKDK